MLPHIYFLISRVMSSAFIVKNSRASAINAYYKCTCNYVVPLISWAIINVEGQSTVQKLKYFLNNFSSIISRSNGSTVGGGG